MHISNHIIKNNKFYLFFILIVFFNVFINIIDIRKNIFACLFSIHNILSLSSHEQVCLSGLPCPMMGEVSLETEKKNPDGGRSISRNIAHLIILVHDVINLLYYWYYSSI